MSRLEQARPRSRFSDPLRVATRLALMLLVALGMAACGEIMEDPTPDPDPVGDLAITGGPDPATGDSNTPVTLTGAYIAGNATVTMDGANASNVVVRDADGEVVTGSTKSGTSVTFNPPALEDGTYEITVSQGSGADAESATAPGTFAYEGTVFVPGDYSLFINSGGPEVETGGVTWVADTPYVFTTGGTFTNAIEIANTDDDVIYQTERHTAGGQFTYVIGVPENGSYQVVFHFAEIWFGVPPQPDAEAGQRVFDVSLQGDVVLDDYDIYVAAGAAATAVTSSHVVEVTDGTISIAVQGVVDNGKLSGVEIHNLDVDGGDEGGGGEEEQEAEGGQAGA